MKTTPKGLFKYWRRKIFILIWITYGTFYLGKENISIAIPAIMKELGCTKTALGSVMSCMFIIYALGQFINGQLGDKFGAKKLISLGLLISGILN